MLHLHFGAGRLGLGLVAPFFQNTDTELYLLNRAVSGTKATGTTHLNAPRRNELLQNNPDKIYLLQSPGNTKNVHDVVSYKAFCSYTSDTVQDVVGEILRHSSGKARGVAVTASVLAAENYSAIIDALNLICGIKEEGGKISNVFFVACENMLSAWDVLQHKEIREIVSAHTSSHVRCVPALVDRMCVGLEEYPGGTPPVQHPTVAVQAEEYGMLKLELQPETKELAALLEGSRVEFSRHLDVEREIKGWLLNGSHWLIALTAYHQAEGDSHLKLNEWINQSDDHHVLAAEILMEMRDGVEILLRSEPQYRDFVRNTNVTQYLDDAAAAIMNRFCSTEDNMTRILARFRSPSAEEASTIQAFTKRLLGRVDPPMAAYERERGMPPKSSTQSLFNLFRLEASGLFVDQEPVKKAA